MIKIKKRSLELISLLFLIVEFQVKNFRTLYTPCVANLYIFYCRVFIIASRTIIARISTIAVPKTSQIAIPVRLITTPDIFIVAFVVSPMVITEELSLAGVKVVFGFVWICGGVAGRSMGFVDGVTPVIFVGTVVPIPTVKMDFVSQSVILLASLKSIVKSFWFTG